MSLKTTGSEKGVFWKRGLFRKVHSLEILENLENPQTVEKIQKGESDHFVESLEILEILEIPPVKRPLPSRPLFPVANKDRGSAVNINTPPRETKERSRQQPKGKILEDRNLLK